MNTWNSIAWFPLCAGLTAVGLVLSWFAARRKGVRSGIRGVAWSLLPMALYLTGSILLVGRIGSAIVQFATSFVFSPKTWAGVILFVLAAVIFLTFGGVPSLSRKKRARKKELRQDAATDGQQQVTSGPGTRAVAEVGPAKQASPAKAPKPAKAAKRGQGGGDEDGLDPEVAAILRRHGIS